MSKALQNADSDKTSAPAQPAQPAQPPLPPPPPPPQLITPSKGSSGSSGSDEEGGKKKKVKYEKRMFVFEYNGKTSYYTYDMLEGETAQWLRDVCRTLNVGQLSKYFSVLFIFFNWCC